MVNGFYNDDSVRKGKSNSYENDQIILSEFPKKQKNYSNLLILYLNHEDFQ